MMENIRTAFREEVANLTWIDDETRPKVYEKVSRTFHTRFGTLRNLKIHL